MKKLVVVLALIIIAIAMMVIPAYACSNWRRYDLNHDGKVDIKDIAIVAKAFGSTKGESRYSPRLDFNHNKIIDIFDIASIAHYYGSNK